MQETPSKRKKRPNVSVRPTSDELDTLHQRAASFGFKSLSKYLIERGLREGEMIVSADRERIERLLYEVRRLGVNVNQIARRLNGGGRGLSDEMIERALREVARVVGEVGETLSS
jgi:nanoRNase/pAp phosphatase (c-di-AMP/oligoRNAs hydrolase)